MTARRSVGPVSMALLVVAAGLGGCASSAGTLPAASLAAAPMAAGPGAFLASLRDEERDAFVQWHRADAAHTAALDRFWSAVEATRTTRRARLRAKTPLSEADYVRAFPPDYTGPRLTAALQQKWDAFNARDPAPPRDELPGVADFLSHAKSHYAFEPERIAEREFKRRYAAEAMALGLGKVQVIRVYALETGGNGTADMQAGIHPITRKGKPISSALGYAQLLHANSIGVLVKHGDAFLARLRSLEQQAGGDAARIKRLKAKQASVRRMLAAARRVPNEWSAHVAYAKTAAGLGIHALNLDGDIGPWLQTTKLKGIVEFAERSGRSSLTSEELELMNLAGPGTGIEMMTPLGRQMPTVNYFSRLGYNRNSVVRGRTAAELLVELGRRMDDGERNPGAREFAIVFDELAAQKAKLVRQ